jgi:hypothetical protein
MSEETRQEVRRLCRNEGWGAVKIARELRRQFEAAGLPAVDVPSERAIGRELAKKLPEAEWRRYDEVRWPDSFGNADLPWASAAAILELTRALGRPPLLPLARWYWRTLQAFPSATVAALYNIAAQLALNEDDDTARRAIGAAAVVGNLPELGPLGPYDASKPEEVERALNRAEIVLGRLPCREGLRQVMDGSYKEGAQDESKG